MSFDYELSFINILPVKPRSVSFLVLLLLYIIISRYRATNICSFPMLFDLNITFKIEQIKIFNV